MRVPCSTYRLQLGPALRFADVEAVIPYLDALGITDLYLSPILKARAGSAHGYDVVDPTRLNPEIGSEEELGRLAERLRARGMAILLDIVPNHMCIADPENPWWADVLENGPSSPYAPFFDIDWRPPKQELEGKVLLPVLGDQYGRVLESQEIRVAYDGGAFYVECYGRRLPLAPRPWRAILEQVRDRLAASDPHRLELESVITALGYLPRRTETTPERVRERQREKEVVKRRLGALAEACGDVRAAIDGVLSELNGARGDPRSFDGLERLLAAQPYRLCYWRVAADEINYRRFFDVNDLAAIRVEEPDVFAAVHEVVFRLVRSGWVAGLRVDHVDGLYDPADYLRRLQEGAPGCHVVVEKILGRGERLRGDWPVAGTTGYDFLNELGGLFVDRSSERSFRDRYALFTGLPRSFADIVNTSKKLIMLVSLASELRVLTWALDRISEQHRYSRDFTRESLRFALREVIASFPAYRSYVGADDRVEPEDRRRVAEAIEDAKRRNPATDASLFDFVGSILAREDPDGLSEGDRAERRRFVLRLQQLTGPIMAKGLEDTAFYRYFPLASLNEVGGDPGAFGLDPNEVHRANRERRAEWPHALLATSTHDTKRGEDVRARLAVLSEVPDAWWEAVGRWHDLSAGHRTPLAGFEAPAPADEYLLYQTLVGAWPLEAGDGPSFRDRVKEYMVKAAREAKLHTSWIKPDPAYEGALLRFIDGLLDESGENPFLEDFRRFHPRIAFLGALNSLAQVVLKAASPGVPDFYQGTELFALTLVDPDNRRPVDFARRARLLADLDRRVDEAGRAAVAASLLERWEDGALKLFVTAAALRFRRARRGLFESGEYVAVPAAGRLAAHAFAFLRRAESGHALVAVPRLLAGLIGDHRYPVGEGFWGDGRLALPAGAPARWRNVLTDEPVEALPPAGGPGAPLALPLGAVFARLPVALLEDRGA